MYEIYVCVDVTSSTVTAHSEIIVLTAIYKDRKNISTNFLTYANLSVSQLINTEAMGKQVDFGVMRKPNFGFWHLPL
jgi:hypothetical protein